MDSLATSYTRNGRPEGVRSAVLVSLARDAYLRNDDGVLTEQLLGSAKSPGTADGVPRTRRVDLWTVLDSASRAPTAPARIELVARLEAALLRAQYEVLGAPRCDAWELEAVRLVALLRIPPPPPPPAPRPVVVAPPPAPAPVVEKPRPEPLASVPSMVHFALDKSYLSPRTKQVLDSMVMVVSKIEGLTVVLEGNTDMRGSVAYNEALSRRRALSVQKYLVETKRLPASTISIRALGKSQLETEATGIVDHARNRRVLLRYYNKDGVEIPTVKMLDDLQLETKPAAKPKR